MLRTCIRWWSAEEGGQGTIEIGLVLPVLMLLVVGMLEFGIAFNHRIALSAATREGARTAGSLANGGGQVGCGPGQSPRRDNVDPQAIAAVERVLTGSGFAISLDDVSEIRLYKATGNGNETPGKANVWAYGRGQGPQVDGKRLDFKEQGAGWHACERSNVPPADSIGVSISYVYRMRTPLGALLPGLNMITMSDRTVMPVDVVK